MLTLAAALWCAPARCAPFPQLATPNWAQLSAYRNAKSYVDRTTAELIDSIPDLKGLEPAADKEQGEKVLKTMLDRVGENVRQFYAKFPDTTSRERITMQKLGPDGEIDSWRNETFRYLALAAAGHGVSTLVEYRTDSAGKRVQSAGLALGYVVTRGFASVAIYLHPALQPDSRFRYLGRQKIDKRDTDVIAFAQRPAWADLPIRVSIGGQTASLLVQGLVWIDPASDQIVRMRTDLLAPSPEVGLTGETTVVTFSEVRFPEMPGTILWLPRKVTVKIQWAGKVPVKTTFDLPDKKGSVTATDFLWGHQTYRNIHRYSDYRLFSTKSRIKY